MSLAVGYHSPGALDAEVDRLLARAGTRASLETFGETVEHRPMRAVTVAPVGHQPDPDRPQAMVLANIHGAEVIGSEIALDVLARLCAEEPVGPAADALAVADVTVVPAIDVDGRTRALHSLAERRGLNAAPRRNARGVDLDRNWPWPDGARAPWLPLAGTDARWLPWYRGPAPLSEPETAALAELLDARRPYATVQLRSTGRVVTHPWGCRPSPPDDLARFTAMIDALRAAQTRWRYRVEQSSARHPTVGSLDDWLYAHYGCLAITVASAPGAAALRDDWRRARWCFWWSNPVDPTPHLVNDAPAVLAAVAAVAP